MNRLQEFLAVACGGALGSMLRYGASLWFLQRFGTGFPWGTLVINVSGAFAIGIVLQLLQTRYGLSPTLRLFAATGILGGYTTFSAFAFETLVLLRGSALLAGLLYAGGSVVLGVAAAYLGTLITRTVFAS